MLGLGFGEFLDPKCLLDLSTNLSNKVKVSFKNVLQKKFFSGVQTLLELGTITSKYTSLTFGRLV